jgi:hypothetical protein
VSGSARFGTPRPKPALLCSLLRREGPFTKLGRDEILSAKVGMIDELEKPQVLVCNEVRGGNHKFIGTRKLPGVVAWVAAIPINEGEGGGGVHVCLQS